MALRRQQTVPAGWATDAKGQVCTDPAKILDEGGLMPLGGAENTSKCATNRKLSPVIVKNS